MASFSSTKFAVSKNPQTNIATAQLATPDLIRFTPNSREIPFPTRNTASNIDELGTGMWPSVLYKLNSIMEKSMSLRASSQMLAWASAFALADVTKSTPGVGARRYTCRPIASRELKHFTVIVQNLEGTADEIIDGANVGVMINSLEFALKQGIDQDTFLMNLGLIGSGRYMSNDGPGTTVATLPALLTLQQMSVADTSTLTFVGQDYQESCRLLEMTLGFNNNLKTEKNYRACANAKENGFHVMSRSTCGKPTATLSARVEAAATSPEVSAFLAGTTGAITISLVGPEIVTGVNHQIDVNLGKAQIASVTPVDDDDIFAYDLTYEIQQPGSGEAFEIVVTTTLDGIYGL